MGILKKRMFSPSRTILLSMIFSIFLGTFLLALPIAQNESVSLIDLLFTSTSALCVTGLMSVPLSNFTTFGLSVIIFLMQIGGLGLITLTFFIMSLFMDLGLNAQVMTGKALDLESWSGTTRLLLFIIISTLIAESIGTFLIFCSLKDSYPFWQALFYSLFQSVSSFCNAGMSIIPMGPTSFYTDYITLWSMIILMIFGGIGFITLREIFESIYPRTHTTKRINFSLQTRIIISYFAGLTLFNMALIWVLEYNHSFAGMSLPSQALNALFLAVSSRSGGFLTAYAQQMEPATLLVIMINGFIGASPGSTGSGIRITTLAILIATIFAVIRGTTSIHIRGRSIAKDQIFKALSVVLLSLVWIIGITFCLLISEQGRTFVEIVFEATSAFSTLGASLGLTPSLSIFGKIIIILTMFIGRIGSLTLLIALQKKHEKQEFSYPEERVMIS